MYIWPASINSACAQCSIKRETVTFPECWLQQSRNETTQYVHQKPVLLVLWRGPTGWQVEIKSSFKCLHWWPGPYIQFHKGKAITGGNIKSGKENHFCWRVLLHMIIQTTHFLTWPLGDHWLEGQGANIPHVKIVPSCCTAQEWYHSE